jgi:hypothetical protein
MRLLLLLAACAVVFAPSARAASSIGCSDYAPAVIEIRPQFGAVDYDTGQPMLKIRALAEAGVSGTQSESWPVGLSVGEFYLNITKDVFKIRSPYDPSTCGQVKALHVDIGFQKNVIYIAREFPKRSCPYRIIEEHEEKHKDVDRELLNEYADKAKVFFTDTAKKIGMVRGGSGAAIDGEIGDEITQAMDQFTGDIEAERRRRQKEVDSNEEYARVSASCEGNLMEIVNDRLALLEETQPGITKKMDGKGHLNSARPANETGY